MTVGALWLFLMEPWVGLQYGIFRSNSKTCLKRPLKNRQNKSLNRKWWLNEGRKYCRMPQGQHSAILSTCTKRFLVLKTNCVVLYEYPLRTGFTVFTFRTLCWTTALFYFRSSGTRHSNWVGHIRNGYTFKGLSN